MFARIFPFLLLAICIKFVYLECSHKSDKLGEEGCGGTGARVLSKELHHAFVGVLEREHIQTFLNALLLIHEHTRLVQLSDYDSLNIHVLGTSNNNHVYSY